MTSTKQSSITEPLLQDIESLLIQRQYLAALNTLRQRLTRIRSQSTREDWRAFCAEEAKQLQNHPLSGILKEGPLSDGFGLIHQPLILDVIYGVAGEPLLLTPVADTLRAWELSLGFCEALRARHDCFVGELNDKGITINKNPRVLSVGCGHLRDAAEALTLDSMRHAEIVAFDRDRSCLDLIEREFEHPGLSTVSGSLCDLVTSPAIGTFDFIYVPALFDTLPDARVTALLDSLIRLLKPGGRLLAANFAPELQDAAYLEACLDWWPIYRQEEELAALVSESSNQNLRGHCVFRDQTEGSIFLDLQLK